MANGENIGHRGKIVQGSKILYFQCSVGSQSQNTRHKLALRANATDKCMQIRLEKYTA